MSLPEAEIARVQAWCDSRVTEAMRQQVQIICEADALSLTILEARPPW